MPNTVLEAIAHGCPVVSFACPTGPDEIIQHGKNGLLVDVGDSDGLAAAMRQVLSDNKLGARLAKGGKSRAAYFSPSKIAKQWLV